MKKQLIFMLISLIGVLSSCDEVVNPSPIPSRYYRSYIDEFIECDSLNINSHGRMYIDDVNKIYDFSETDDPSEGIAISVNGTNPAAGRGNHPTNIYYSVPFLGSTGFLMSNGDDPNDPYYQAVQAGYDKYIEEVGDTAYNREFYYGEKRNIVVSIAPLKEVIITADKSFGSDYPAGTDLSSLFRIIFNDLYATIQNDYRAVSGTYSYVPSIYSSEALIAYPRSTYCLKLSEANLEDYPFTEAIWEFFLEAKPEKTDTYTFHVKFTFANGTVLEGDSKQAIMVKGTD